jgi:hypothetical protein
MLKPDLGIALRRLPQQSFHAAMGVAVLTLGVNPRFATADHPAQW